MAEQTKQTSRAKSRVARHRSGVAARGSKRVEVTIPFGDAVLVKAIAGVLRGGGNDAKRIRDSLLPIVSRSRAKTGPELVAFFRRSPLVGADIPSDRDPSTGRLADLG